MSKNQDATLRSALDINVCRRCEYFDHDNNGEPRCNVIPDNSKLLSQITHNGGWMSVRENGVLDRCPNFYSHFGIDNMDIGVCRLCQKIEVCEPIFDISTTWFYADDVHGDDVHKVARHQFERCHLRLEHTMATQGVGRESS